MGCRGAYCARNRWRKPCSGRCSALISVDPGDDIVVGVCASLIGERLKVIDQCRFFVCFRFGRWIEEEGDICFTEQSIFLNCPWRLGKGSRFLRWDSPADDPSDSFSRVLERRLDREEIAVKQVFIRQGGVLDVMLSYGYRLIATPNLEDRDFNWALSRAGTPAIYCVGTAGVLEIWQD